MSMSRFLVAISAIVSVCVPALAAETHADGVIAEILANVAKIKKADPQAVPMAFWDFDGTIIKGDVSEGLTEDGVQKFKGLQQLAIENGFSTCYPAQGGWERYRDSDYPRLNELGQWLAWPFNAQIFKGVESETLDRFSRRHFEETYHKWFFTSSVKIFKALKAAGVENYVISCSPDVFVRNAAESLGIPRSHILGIRVEEPAGRMSTRIVYPLPIAEGKIDSMRALVASHPHGVAVAGFGNSYFNDAPFMRAIVTQTNLPGGAKGVAMMINGMKKRPGYEGLFITVTEDEVMGK